jgi:hemoglobin
MSVTIDADTCAPARTRTVSIYQAIGGRAAVAAAVDNFFGRLLADPTLAAFVPGGVGPKHRAYVVTVLGEALGGPERYRGPDLAAAHGGLGISNAHFDATAAHLSAALDELGVPINLIERIVALVAGLRSAVVSD